MPYNLEEEIRTRLIKANGLTTKEAIISMAELFSSKFSELEREIEGLEHSREITGAQWKNGYYQALRDVLKLFNQGE